MNFIKREGADNVKKIAQLQRLIGDLQTQLKNYNPKLIQKLEQDNTIFKSDNSVLNLKVRTYSERIEELEATLAATDGGKALKTSSDKVLSLQAENDELVKKANDDGNNYIARIKELNANAATLINEIDDLKEQLQEANAALTAASASNNETAQQS